MSSSDPQQEEQIPLLSFPKHDHSQDMVYNVNDLTEPEQLTLGEHIADSIAEFSGTTTFLLINLLVFVFWIIGNTIGRGIRFDPYPFQFLTMAVSLEAIFLSLFILISQNRQAAKDRIKADLDYDVDVKAEQELGIIMEHLHHQDAVLASLSASINTTTQDLDELNARLALVLARRAHRRQLRDQQTFSNPLTEKSDLIDHDEAQKDQLLSAFLDVLTDAAHQTLGTFPDEAPST